MEEFEKIFFSCSFFSSSWSCLLLLCGSFLLIWLFIVLWDWCQDLWLLWIGTGFSTRKITAFPLGRGRKGKDGVGHIDNNIWSCILGQLFYSSSILHYAPTHKKQESYWSQGRNTDKQGNYLGFHANVQLWWKQCFSIEGTRCPL